MASFDNLDTPAGLGKFNQFLSDKTYLSGYTPSAKDFEVFGTIKAEPSEKFVNALRWYKHIASFTAEERAEVGSQVTIEEAPKEAEKKPAGDDDDFDLFGEDDDDEREAEIERIAEEQRKKKAAKPNQVIAKSSIVFDIKPWEAETDLEELQRLVRAIELEGLIWGAGDYKDIAYGVKKLVIMCTVVDDLVSPDDLIERISEFEDFVQSVDIAAFNKV